MLQYKKALQINPYAVKTFTLSKGFYNTSLGVYDGVIVSASDSRLGISHDLFEPNWKTASNVLLQFYREDSKAFREILKMLDRDGEEYKDLQSAMEDFIHGITSNQSEIQDYESLLKSF